MPLIYACVRPSVEGWYWVRGCPKMTNGKETIAHIIIDSVGRAVWLAEGDVEGDVFVEDTPLGNLWAGPIVRPVVLLESD